ncbi:MAG: OmpH family outer membrane protein [Bacteroidetes bacterium]|nr:OmpH family outer membrane protein [Bacteroidota bacterium]MBS1977125.1 OmpH family outer membrane protein [Bacteroidota bacterium]
MRTLFVILLVSLVSIGATAQTTTTQTQPVVQKIGYAEWDYIFSQLPEFKQIDNDLKTHGDQLQSQLQAKYKEYETKLKTYQASASTMVDAVRRDKETELTQLQENIQKFQQDAEASLRKKQSDLMEPVYAKVGKAIEEVAKENGYSFIINPQLVGGGDILLYNDEKYNISTLVLKKLGITPTASTTVQPKK